MKNLLLALVAVGSISVMACTSYRVTSTAAVNDSVYMTVIKQGPAGGGFYVAHCKPEENKNLNCRRVKINEK